MDNRDVIQRFFQSLNAHDVDAALGAADPSATLSVMPLQLEGTMADEGRTFLNGLVNAFPDLRVRVNRMVASDDGVAAVEANFEGTQAADFFGVINQEKHMDLDHAWRFELADGKITACRVFWCQAQLFRRLAVKRLDKVTITG